ncbi:MAG TPA: alkaline phosphatase family protein [Chitinophagales bacterium]|nr:alkaline phosphatase family protein [Chitinophagales bacterium]
MKHLLIAALLLTGFTGFAQTDAKTHNVIIVTFDGYRWQEVFGGAQKRIINSKKYTKDMPEVKAKYWDNDPIKRREKLMPFFWNVIAKQGQLYGNKKIGNQVTLTNGYKFSFPGYNEIFTGWGDHRINSNDYGDDPNLNIFDFLLTQKGFEGKMAAFATWDAFPKIINSHRNHVPVYVDFKPGKDGLPILKDGLKLNSWSPIPASEKGIKTDTLTYKVAREYLAENHPHFAFIGFDETDGNAHDGDYEAYLNAANNEDKYMEDLWNFIQSDPQYKDNTTLIITCDHGRGDIPLLEWRHHGHVFHAENIWIAMIGAGVQPKGEIKEKELLHQNQIAATIAKLFGYTYKVDHFAGQPISGVSGN